MFAWGLAALAGGAFGFVPGIVREKENRRDERNGAIIALKGKMAEDENASIIAIAAVLRETTGHREVKDEAEAALKESEEKLEFLQAEEEKVGKEIEETEKEGIDLGQVRLDVQAKVADTKIRLEPLQRNADELAAQRKALEEELAGVRMGNQTLQTQLDKLVAKRDEILVDFREREKFYRKTIKIPPWFYYGDKLNLAVTNARPSGTGVFLPIGIENGVKGGMEFLARRIDPTAPSRRSRRLRATLVQSNYCFAEEIPGFGEPGISLRAGENLEIERSGETSRDQEKSAGRQDEKTDAIPASQDSSAETVSGP